MDTMLSRTKTAQLAFSCCLACCLACLFTGTSAPAQEVSTITLSTAIKVDGIELAPDGNLLGAGAWGGSNLYRISVSDGQVSTVATGLQGPIEVAVDTLGNRFVTNWQRAQISQVDPDGVVTAFATVPLGGDGVALGPNGDLWHTNGSNDRVSRIAPDGTVTVISSNAGLGYPLGIALADDGQMYVAGARSGKIWRMAPTGEANLVATVPSAGTWVIGHVVAGEGCLYASGLHSNKIFRITLTGEVTEVAGTGASGWTDGPADQATFTFPNGLALSADGQRLYVTSGGGHFNRLRVIYLGLATPVPALSGGLELHSISPNPFNPATEVKFNIASAGAVRVEVFDVRGRLVTTLIDRDLAAGEHRVTWNADGNPSGLYLVRVTSAGQMVVGRVMLVG
jgi:sugar lactone lactonase YvrE